MIVTPININNDYKRYQKLDDTKVIDTVSHRIYTSDNSDELINKLYNVARINTDLINSNTTGKLLNVNV